MAESNTGQRKNTTVIRTMNVKIMVERWDWDNEKYKDTINLTPAVMSYNWTNTIKSPSGGATITLLPQNTFNHFLDDLHPLDVVKIYEFDTLKWQGYIRRVGGAGYIEQDGSPHRTVTLQCTSFGGYLLETVVSVNIQIIRNNVDFTAAAVALATGITRAARDGLTYNEAVNELITEWFKFLSSAAGSDVQSKYLNRYVDFTTAMTNRNTPGSPKDVFLFSGQEDQINLWSIIEKLAEVPLNEFFFDVGPRKVHIDGTTQRLTKDMTYLIGRPTPFDGVVTVTGGVVGPEENRFQLMDAVVISQQHLTRFDFNRSMDEVFSVYITSPEIVDLSTNELIASGSVFIDELALKKYLYKLCNKPLYYQSGLNHAAGTEADKKKTAVDRSDAISITLHNWYKNNDKFLSGTIGYMVPSNANDDPRIGNRVAIEGLEGSFYAEGISHSWRYQGPLTATASVTRGWAQRGPINLKGRIFKRPKSGFWDVDLRSGL